MSRHSIRRGRSPLVTALAVVVLTGLAACSWSSDGNSSDAGVGTEECGDLSASDVLALYSTTT